MSCSPNHDNTHSTNLFRNEAMCTNSSSWNRAQGTFLRVASSPTATNRRRASWSSRLARLVWSCRWTRLRLMRRTARPSSTYSAAGALIEPINIGFVIRIYVSGLQACNHTLRYSLPKIGRTSKPLSENSFNRIEQLMDLDYSRVT